MGPAPAKRVRALRKAEEVRSAKNKECARQWRLNMSEEQKQKEKGIGCLSREQEVEERKSWRMQRRSASEQKKTRKKNVRES